MIQYIALLLSGCDVTLTFYTFYLMGKKGLFDPDHEINPVGRYLLRKGLSVKRYLLMAALALSVLSGAMWFGSPGVAWFITGALVVANMGHSANIKYIKDVWNDEAYWFFRKKVFECETLLKREV